MTSISRRTRPIFSSAVLAATGAALLFGGMHYASPAHADRIGGGMARAAQYDACVLTAQSISVQGYDLAAIQTSCCNSLGGVVVRMTSGGVKCLFPESIYGQTTPPSGTVILPPDAGQNQLGPTQPPAPIVILPPGSNTRAGIQ